MHSQITQAGAPVEQIVRRRRDHHLPPVRGSSNSCGAVDVDPYIAFRCYKRLTGMDSHPHAEWALGQRALPLARRVQSIAGPGERVEERVTLRVDLDSAAFRECGTKNAPMSGEYVRVPVTKAVQVRGRPLDVSEEEGDRPGRESAHSSMMEWAGDLA
jgi:hypothetical protein